MYIHPHPHPPHHHHHYHHVFKTKKQLKVYLVRNSRSQQTTKEYPIHIFMLVKAIISNPLDLRYHRESLLR